MTELQASELPNGSASSQALIHLADLIEPPASAEEEDQIDSAFRSLRVFVKQAWHIVEPGTPYVHGPHIDVICDHLEAVTRGEIRRLLINIPPRHMKSLLCCVFWPTWEWLHIPAQRWIFASYSLYLSKRDNGKARSIVESAWFMRRWGHMVRLRGDTKSKTLFANTKTGFRFATSTSASTTGEGGNRLVFDDPHNVKQAESDTKRKAAHEFWDQAMSTRGDDPKKVAKIAIGQRTHEDDLFGHCLIKGGYEHICLPTEYDGKKRSTVIMPNYDWRTEMDELLWPERMGRPEVEELKKDLGPYGTAGQLQQSPAPAEGGIYKRFWWRLWCYAGQKDKLPPVLVRNAKGEYIQLPLVELPRFELWAGWFNICMQSWDMAFKDAKSSSFVVGQVWGRKGANKFLLDQIRDKLDMPATLDAVRAVTKKWPITYTKIVEDKANGPAVIQTLTSSISGLIPFNPNDRGDKVARANAAVPQIAAGNVYVPHPAISTFTEGLINEAAGFPNATYKDQVDAMNQALLFFEQGVMMRESELSM